MPISVTAPTGEIASRLARKMRFDPHVTVLDDDEQARWRAEVKALIAPEANIDLDVQLLAVSSHQRESYLFGWGGDFAVVDDVLRRSTFEVMESFTYTRDRPFIPWSYLALVLGEVIQTSGAPSADELLQDLLAIVESRTTDELTTDGCIDRLSLLARVINLDGELMTPDERLRAQAAHVYPLYHEIAHLYVAAESAKASVLADRMRRQLDIASEASRVSDFWALYWNDAARFGADPGLGPLRSNRDHAETTEQCRDEVVEELLCDWYALCLLLASERFAALPAQDLVEVVLRHLSLNQWLVDARHEVHQIARRRKRFRTLVVDATTVRQQRLLATVSDEMLTEQTFGPAVAETISGRLAEIDHEGHQNACGSMVLRRQHIRSLCLSYPSPEDERVWPDIRKAREAYRHGHLVASSGEALMVQPAEWGAGDLERVDREIERYAGGGRLKDRTVHWDDAERLMPYLAEAYNLLHVLRRVSLLRDIDPERDIPVPASSDEMLQRIGRAQRIARQSMMNWLYGDAETAVMNTYAVCLSCHAGFQVELSDLGGRIDLDQPLSEPWPIECPECGAAPMGHSLMGFDGRRGREA